MSRPTSEEMKEIELANRMLDRATELAIRRPDRTAKIRPRAWAIMRTVVQGNAYFQAPKPRAKPERVPKADKDFRKACRALLKGLDKELRQMFSYTYGTINPNTMWPWHRQPAMGYVEAMQELYRSYGWTYKPPSWYQDIREEVRDRVLQTA